MLSCWIILAGSISRQKNKWIAGNWCATSQKHLSQRLLVYNYAETGMKQQHRQASWHLWMRQLCLEQALGFQSDTNPRLPWCFFTSSTLTTNWTNGTAVLWATNTLATRNQVVILVDQSWPEHLLHFCLQLSRTHQSTQEILPSSTQNMQLNIIQVGSNVSRNKTKPHNLLQLILF